MSKLKINVIKNSIANVLQKIVLISEQLLLVPFFITAWGVDYYGEWITLTIIPSILSLSNFGFGTAAKNSFVLSYSSGKVEEAADIFKSGFLIVTLSIILGILLSGLVIFILDSLKIFNQSLINREEAIISVSILIFSRFLYFYSELFTARFIVARKADKSTYLISFIGILNLLAAIITLTLGYGVIIFAASQLLVSVLFTLVYSFIGLKILKIDFKYKSRLRRNFLFEVGKKGFSYFMNPISQLIYFQGTILVARVALGPEAVVIFSTVRKLVRSVNHGFHFIKASVLPEFQFQIASGNIQKAQKMYKVSFIITLFFTFLGALFLSIFGLYFYNIWTNNELEVPLLMWNIFNVGLIFASIWYSSEMVFEALNKPFYLAYWSIISSLFSVIMSYFLCKYFNLTGLALGCLFFDLILAFIVLPKACILLNIKIKNLIIDGFAEIMIIFSQIKIFRK